MTSSNPAWMTMYLLRGCPHCDAQLAELAELAPRDRGRVVVHWVTRGDGAGSRPPEVTSVPTTITHTGQVLRGVLPAARVQQLVAPLQDGAAGSPVSPPHTTT
jgi:hypothetical protein